MHTFQQQELHGCEISVTAGFYIHQKPAFLLYLISVHQNGDSGVIFENDCLDLCGAYIWSVITSSLLLFCSSDSYNFS